MTGDIQRRPSRRNAARNPATGFRGGISSAALLTNAASNLIALCPNHHRIIHATHAEFMRKEPAFKYPSGLVERVKVDRHLNLKGSR